MKESTCDWEIISPILNDSEKCWNDIEKICNVLKEQLHAFVDYSCAIRIHIGKDKHVDLMELYRYLEPLTYAISVGEDMDIPPIRIKKYAATLAFADKKLWKKALTQDETKEDIRKGKLYLVDSYFASRLLGLNFTTGKTASSTIEFRTFNGTLNPKIILSYIIYVTYIVCSVKNRNYTVLPQKNFYEMKENKFIQRNNILMTV